MKRKSLEYGLVLGGGGTKGAYQVGVAKALKEMKIKVTAVAGTSVGAINGLFILQDNIKLMEDLYLNMKFDNVFKDDIVIDDSKDIFDVKNIFNIAVEYIKKNGLDNTALREMLEKYVDIDKIYKSNTDLGIVTYSVSDKNVVEKFKNEMSKNELLDYVLASACFPIFKKQKINDEEYIDGGVGDVIPINMLIKKGYKNIIAVDIEGIGITQSSLDKDTYVKVIYSKEDLGGMFDFDRNKIERNIKKGYLDTLRNFNRLQGNMYYFNSMDFCNAVTKLGVKTIYGLECAANLYEIDNYRVYTVEELIDLVMEKHEKFFEEYKSINGVIDAAKLLQKNKKIGDILDVKFGVCLFIDLLSTRPTFINNKILENNFSEYLCAACALLEIKNEFLR